jgi:hypothetical protein
MTDPDRSHGTGVKPAIIRFVGTPNEQFAHAEQTRWKRFLSFFWPFANKAGLAAKQAVSLADEFRAAEIAKRNAVAGKLAAQAADISAAKDTKRQENMRIVNSEIERIFSDNGSPEIAKKLQLANLLAENPQIAEQLELLESLYDKFRLQYGMQAEIERPTDVPLDEEDEEAI